MPSKTTLPFVKILRRKVEATKCSKLELQQICLQQRKLTSCVTFVLISHFQVLTAALLHVFALSLLD